MVDSPPESPSQAVTRILSPAGAGDQHASRELPPLVRGDLRRPAAAHLARFAPGQTQHPRDAEVVTLSSFGGLTPEEIARVLSPSTRAARRDRRFAARRNGRLSGRG